MAIRSPDLRAAAAALLLAAAARAAPPPVATAPAPILPGVGGHWSVATGETVSPDRDAIAVQMGWPGITFGYLHGLSDRSDFGFKIELLYSNENTKDTTFGFGGNIPFRLVVNKREKVLLGLSIEPGFRAYTRNDVTDVLLRFPVTGTLGIQVSPDLRIGASAGLNMAINVTHTTFLELGPQFGLAGEYNVDRLLLLGVHARFGPQFYTYSNSPRDLAFTTEIVVGYRM